MFDWFTKDSNDAISLLKKDHDTVKQIFDEFDDAKQQRSKKKIVEQALTELRIHAALEEEIFYPAVRAALEQDVMNEADEEHHVAKVLIAELTKMTGGEDHYDAKFQVLAENVRHHIKEEESEMLPKAKSLPIDFDALGEKMLRRKEQLLADGIPLSAEDKVAKPRADSPAAAARKRKPVAKRKTTAKKRAA